MSRAFLFAVGVGLNAASQCVDSRPPLGDRTFRSETVEAAIEKVAQRMTDPTLACIFRNAFPNCLDTTIYSFQQARVPLGEAGGQHAACDNAMQPAVDDTFVVTGDIKAMWLRDSTNQVLPYLRFAQEDAKLKALLRGVVRRQTTQIATDVYANAFNIDHFPNPNKWAKDDQTQRPSYLVTKVDAIQPLIFERKYELDSLCAFLKMSAAYFEATNDSSPFDETWVNAVTVVLKTMQSQQKSTAEDDGLYSFQRCTSCEPTDTLSHGTGFPVARTGLVRSAFRPSDDACQYGFLVPANAMAVVELRRVAGLLTQLGKEAELSKQLELLATEIDAALQKVALVSHRESDQHVFAYEVDGFGNAYHMDDANVPSLLSLPYLGYVPANDSTYLATRKLVLSNTTNPFFFLGSRAEGVGSPHTGINKVWPMGLIMRALTSENESEIMFCLEMLKNTTASKWFMHESFDKDDADTFTRPWFSWANSLFGELILRLADSRPHLIFGETTV